MTLNELVYDIKNIAYGGTTSDDAKVSDRQIAHWIRMYRSVLVRQEITSRSILHQTYIQHLRCVELEPVDMAECCSANAGCVVLRSKKQLPKTITVGGREHSLTTVTSFDDQQTVDSVSYLEAKYNAYSRFSSSKPKYFLKNDYLYIVTDNLALGKVNVSGIFEDPDQVGDFSDCDGKPCWTWDTEYPISTDIAKRVVDFILQERMGVVRPAPEDTMNDARDGI
jgi:hypothetical protein